MGSTSINSLPSSQTTQQSPDFNQMYQQNPTPLVGASSPGTENFGNGEPIAANDGGMGAFGGAFGW
jgi:hypothetical protein